MVSPLPDCGVLAAPLAKPQVKGGGQHPTQICWRFILTFVGNLDELVDGALDDHDPESRLGAISATLTELALDEPSIGDGSRALFPITDAKFACLANHGVEMADGMIIPEDRQ